MLFVVVWGLSGFLTAGNGLRCTKISSERRNKNAHEVKPDVPYRNINCGLRVPECIRSVEAWTAQLELRGYAFDNEIIN